MLVILVCLALAGLGVAAGWFLGLVPLAAVSLLVTVCAVRGLRNSGNIYWAAGLLAVMSAVGGIGFLLSAWITAIAVRLSSGSFDFGSSGRFVSDILLR